MADAVILVHGLWMHGIVFALHQRRLKRFGFSVTSFSYRSVRRTLSENADALAQRLEKIEAPRIHLVGHSLGGLVVLRMLSTHGISRLGRVVLMGVPYGGSHCASVLLRTPGLAATVGRSVPEWLAVPPPPLPAAIEIGVVAGDRSIGLGRLIPGLPRPNDGLIALAETHLPTARDSVVLPVGHSQMMVSRRCTDALLSFLTTGNFSHA